MAFTSRAFLCLFIVTLIGLRLLPTRSLRQMLILAVSIIFYSYWKPIYVLLIATCTVVDYWCALLMADSQNQRHRKIWLIFSLITNLGLLAYFKYSNFFLSNLALLSGRPFEPLDIALPIGISFFTFKTLSYTIDVYRNTIPVVRRFWQYAMFVAYFPDLIAGPIVRASVFLPQLARSLEPSWSRFGIGFQMALLGITKKMVIADQFAAFVDPIFEKPDEFSPLTVGLGVIAYSIQIYCDFSGYSDIAIGISHIIGIDLPENFNMPYLSTSITEFWRRWHRTLSSWLRDYLYIPLGGNRKGKIRTYINLMITMLLGGLWHGANWTFVAWGLLHGVALAAHKIWMEITGGRFRPLRGFGGWLLTYGFVCFGWIFFRSADFHTAGVILRKLIGMKPGGVSWLYSPFFLLVPLVILGHWLGVIAARQSRLVKDAEYVPAPDWAKRFYSGAKDVFAIRPNPFAGLYMRLPLPGFVGGFALTVWLLFVLFFSAIKSNPFIYFQF